MQNMKDEMKYASYFQKLEAVVKIMCWGGKDLKQNTKEGEKKKGKERKTLSMLKSAWVWKKQRTVI